MRWFPVLMNRADRMMFPDCPAAIPWDVLAPHEAQAQRNHGGQTLARLAERGGLCPLEIIPVIEDRSWGYSGEWEPAMRGAIDRLKTLIPGATE